MKSGFQKGDEVKWRLLNGDDEWSYGNAKPKTLLKEIRAFIINYIVM